MPLRSLWKAYRKVVYFAFRPVLDDVHTRLDVTSARFDRLDQMLTDPAGAVWQGGLADGGLASNPGDRSAGVRGKYRSELAYWVDMVRDERKATAMIGSPFHPAAVYWSSQKAVELQAMLGIESESAFRTWCHQQRVVEIGTGPHPFISDLRWRQAIAVDPLMDGYQTEGLLPPDDDDTVFIAGAGEQVPLPSGRASLVVMENCLDHTSDPSRVLAEARRLLQKDGMLWLLVDLAETTNELHPHAFHADGVRTLLTAAGFKIVSQRVKEHSSRSEAYGELRVLAQVEERSADRTTSNPKTDDQRDPVLSD